MKYLILVSILFLGNCVSAQDINQFDANGKRHGVWKKTFEGTNEVRYEGQFNHGKEIGLFNFYKYIDKTSVLSATKQFNEYNNNSVVFA